MFHLLFKHTFCLSAVSVCIQGIALSLNKVKKQGWTYCNTRGWNIVMSNNIKGKKKHFFNVVIQFGNISDSYNSNKNKVLKIIYKGNIWRGQMSNWRLRNKIRIAFSEGLLVFNTDIVMYNKSSSPEPHSFMHLQLNNIELSYLSFKLFYSYPAFVQKGTFMINVLSNTVKEYLSQYPHLRRSELTSAAKLPQPLQTSTAIPAV